MVRCAKKRWEIACAGELILTDKPNANRLFKMSESEASRPSSIYYVLGTCAVVHSTLLLTRAMEFLPDGLPKWCVSDRFWITVALLWFLWPIVLALHPRRSWRRFAVPVVLSLLFLVPASRFYYWIIEEELHSPPSPKPGQPLVEKSEDVGGGFRRVMLAEYVEGGFESVYHGEYLFYRDRKLAFWLADSVAPSRQFAIYLDTESKHLVLFRVAEQRVVELDHEPINDFGGFDWDEANGKVTLRYSSARAPRHFSLN